MPSAELTQAVTSTKYPLDAFVFVQRALDFTVRRAHGEFDDTADMPEDERPSRHVSGRELCLGVRDFAIQQYGMLAGTVLRRWRITRSDDFGQIVFAMVDAGMMHKTEQDSLDDFADVFSFREAFGNQPLTLS